LLTTTLEVLMADELEVAEASEAVGGGGLLDTIKKYLPLIVGILVVQIIIFYILAKVFWGSSPADPPAEEHAAKVEKEKPAEGAEHKPKPEKKKEKDKKEAHLEPADEIAVVFDKLDPIVINPAGSGGNHYVQIQVNLGLTHIEGGKDEEALHLVESRKAKIMDTIIRIATSKTLDELNTEEGRTRLKEEIRKQINLFLNDEHEIVKEVYFATFTTQ
jgi:flagellar basal body-associated protein FliL